MKKILLVFFISIISLSCQEDADLPELQYQDPYIEFDANTRNDADENGVVSVAEAPDGAIATTYTAKIENPFGVLNQDVTVTYAISGDAVFGTDFTIPDATASGGSFVLVNRDPDDADEDTGNPSTGRSDFDLVISFPSDATQDGTKTLVVTLVSGTGADGAMLGVRSGLPTASVLTIDIADADCGFARGDYNVNGNILVSDFGDGPFNYAETVLASACPDEAQYNIADITGGLYGNPTSAYVSNYGTTARAAVIVIDETTGSVTWGVVDDQFGGEITEDPASSTASNYNSTTNTITIYWTATAFGERGITTYTLQ